MLTFDISWLNAPGVRDPAEAAAWAEVTIRVGDVAVSRLVDERMNSVRSGFFGSVLPLAEWMVDSWPRLIHERRSPVPMAYALGTELAAAQVEAESERTTVMEWIGFHSLRAGRQGSAMPNLRILRFDDNVFAVRANADVALAPGMTVRFIEGAYGRISADAVMREFHRVVEAVLARISGVSSPRASRLRHRWGEVRSEIACAAGRLGLDDESIDPAGRGSIESVLERPDREVILGVAEASAAVSLEDRVAQGFGVADAIPESAAVSPMWRSLEDALEHSRLDKPWLTGWAAASAFRRAAGLKATTPPRKALSAILEERCGWPGRAQLFGLPYSPAGVDTVHVRLAGSMPVVLTKTNIGSAQRFRIARSLYHFLFGAAGTGSLAIADSPLIPGRLSEANAFAAELLAPVDVIRAEAPSNGVWSVEATRAMANKLSVGPSVVKHQIENHDLGITA